MFKCLPTSPKVVAPSPFVDLADLGFWSRQNWNTEKTSSCHHSSKHPTGEHFQQRPWCIGKTQDESELLFGRGALLHLITWLWVYICCIYSLQFWRIPRPDLSHTCAMDSILAYPWGGFVNVWCVSSNSLTDAWCLFTGTVGKICGHICDCVKVKPLPIIWLKLFLVLGPYQRGKNKTSQEEDLESRVK